MITKNSKLSGVEKMHYLKESLTGPALDTIRDMSLTQFSEAWDALINRFQNDKVLTFAILKKLLELPQANEVSTEIRLLIDRIKSARINLADLGEKVNEWNSLFVFLVTQRLSKNSFEAWEQSCTSKRVVPQFAALEIFLEDRLHILQAGEKRVGNMTRSFNVEVKSAVAPSLQKSNSCDFCYDQHLNYKCPKLSACSVAEKRKWS